MSIVGVSNDWSQPTVPSPGVDCRAACDQCLRANLWRTPLPPPKLFLYIFALDWRTMAATAPRPPRRTHPTTGGNHQ